MDPDQTAPIGAVCSGSTLFASMLNSSVMLGKYLQQTSSADDNFRFFSWRFRVNYFEIQIIPFVIKFRNLILRNKVAMKKNTFLIFQTNTCRGHLKKTFRCDGSFELVRKNIQFYAKKFA